MRARWLIAAAVAVFAGAQFIRPERVNPPADPGRSIQADAGTTSELAAVLDRSCGDCHSNNSVWPPLAEVAPLSWVMASAVSEGRKAVNFSEWTAYSPDGQRTLLSASCDAASAGKMPGPYTWVKAETTLSQRDIEIICTAARQAGTTAAR